MKSLLHLITSVKNTLRKKQVFQTLVKRARESAFVFISLFMLQGAFAQSSSTCTPGDVKTQTRTPGRQSVT